MKGLGEFHPAGELQPEHGIPNRAPGADRIEGENSGMGLV